MAHLYMCCSKGGLRLVLVMVGVLLVCYTVRPALYWHLKRSSSSGQASCPCVCNCPSESDDFFPLGAGLTNGTFIDCGKNDPDLSEEMEKGIVALLSEELTLQKVVANESLEHTNVLILSARKTSLQYQREAEKCNSGMETCEEARERAENELIEERRLTELWEKRARKQGWKDD